MRGPQTRVQGGGGKFLLVVVLSRTISVGRDVSTDAQSLVSMGLEEEAQVRPLSYTLSKRRTISSSRSGRFGPMSLGELPLRMSCLGSRTDYPPVGDRGDTGWREERNVFLITGKTS